MDFFQQKESEERTKQLKFFGAKKTSFISIYAKKPRVRISCNIKSDTPTTTRHDALLSLYNAQMQAGIERSSAGYNQMALAQQSMGNAASGQYNGLGVFDAGLYALIGGIR